MLFQTCLVGDEQAAKLVSLEFRGEVQAAGIYIWEALVSKWYLKLWDWVSSLRKREKGQGLNAGASNI